MRFPTDPDQARDEAFREHLEDEGFDPSDRAAVAFVASYYSRTGLLPEASEISKVADPLEEEDW